FADLRGVGAGVVVEVRGLQSGFGRGQAAGWPRGRVLALGDARDVLQLHGRVGREGIVDVPHNVRVDAWCEAGGQAGIHGLDEYGVEALRAHRRRVAGVEHTGARILLGEGVVVGTTSEKFETGW